MSEFRKHACRWLATATIALCATAAATLQAQEASAPAHDEPAARLERLHDYLRQATDAQGYLGAVSLVMRDGRIVDWQAYGHRDLARRQPMRKDDIFRIYSMTKTVTSVAVMMLVEEGRLSLDDPLSRYLPGFDAPQVMIGGTADAPALRPASRPITLHALLTHTAGFPAGLKSDGEATKRMERIDPHGSRDLREFAERMSHVSLAADPDIRFGYDGASIELMARVVEVVSNQPFDRFLQQRIFAPLKMQDTGFSVPPAQRSRVVDLTTMDAHGTLVVAETNSARHPGEALNAYASGAGGLYSTAGDYARFAQMLLNGGALGGARLLNRKSVELMMRNHLTMLDPPVTQFSDAEGFGIGGYVVIDAARRGQLGSNGQFGWSGAASTYYTIDPQERLVAILLLQHLPRDGVKDLPHISRPFYNLVYQSLP